MLTLLVGCFPDLTPPETLTDNPFRDYDGDGYAAFDADCDDTDPTVFPGAEELHDSLDNDCDDVVDEGFEPSDSGLVEEDADGDGWTADEDCNEDIASINPGAEEVPGNSVDEDCDGVVCPAAAGFVGTMNLSEVALALEASAPGAFHVATGDLNQDGLLELIVGVPSEDAVYLMSEGGFSEAHRIGGDEETQFGTDVAVADLDDDGDEELIVLTSNGGLDGEVHVFHDPWSATSPDGGILVGVASGVGLHDWMQVADLDGDGLPELVFTATVSGSDVVWVVPGKDLAAGGMLEDSAEVVLYAGEGQTVQYMTAGDLDGDGVQELVLGGVDEDRPRAWAFQDPPESGILDQRAPPIEDLGKWPVADGDLDGDGITDLSLGDDLALGQAGAAWVLSGASLWSEPDPIVYVEGDSGMRLGRDMTMAWDPVGDGTPTLVVAARAQSRTLVFHEPAGLLAVGDADATFVGDGHAGMSLDVLPDLDGDCVEELAIGPGLGTTLWLIRGATE